LSSITGSVTKHLDELGLRYRIDEPAHSVSAFFVGPSWEECSPVAAWEHLRSRTHIKQITVPATQSKLLSFPGGRFNPHDEDERARYAGYALARRAGEAATLRVALSATLDGHGDQRPVILTGDLNDTGQAATTQLLQGPPGSEIGTRGFPVPDQGDPMRMWNLTPLMPPGRDYSRINQGRHELIDHILVSKALLAPLTSVTAEALTDATLPSIEANGPTARRNSPASDHAPVLASFADL
jgi:hypothetical protein